MAQRPDIRISTPDADSSTGPHRLPGIVALPGAIVCTWQETSRATPFLCGRWDVAHDSMAMRIPWTPPKGPAIPDSSQLVGMSYYFTVVSDYKYVTFSGDAGAYYVNGFTGIVKVHPMCRLATSAPAGSSVYALVRPAENGWVCVDQIERSYDACPPRSHEVLGGRTIGYDQAEGAIAVLLEETQGKFGGSTAWLRIYRRNGTAWEQQHPWEFPAQSVVLPYGRGRYIVANANGTYRVTAAVDTGLVHYTMNGKYRIDTLDMPKEGLAGFRYFKLLGSRFIRTAWSVDGAPRFHVELFDTTGLRRADVELPRSSRTDDYMLVQSPADSVIAVLFGAENGLRAIVLGSGLAVIDSGVVISRTNGKVTHPAGAFRHDTLFAVWEDDRDGATRIYGNVVAPVNTFMHRTGESEIAEHHEGSNSIEGLIIYPNPASGEIAIVRSLRDSGEGIFDLISTLGEVVLHADLSEIRPGAQQMNIDISGLPNGTYIARLSLRGHMVSKLIVKQ